MGYRQLNLQSAKEETLETGTGSRLLHLDFLRIAAIFLVVFNHTGNFGFFLFSVAEQPWKQWCYLFLSIFIKVAVPLFFMISGALLLGREESYRDIFRKRIFKYALILLLVSLCYYCYETLASFLRGEPIMTGKQFAIMVYSSEISVQLWYLYSYLALLMMLPLLRKLAIVMSNTDYIYLALMSLVMVGIVPIVDYLLGQGQFFLNSRLKGALFTATNIVYFLMGYYFEYRMPKQYRRPKWILWLWLMSILAIVVCAWMTLYRGKMMGELSEANSQKFHNALIAVPTYTVYISAKFLFERVRISKGLEKWISVIGGATFGLYLMEGVVRPRTFFIFELLEPWIGTLPACLAWVSCAVVLGILLILVLKKLPVVNKML